MFSAATSRLSRNSAQPPPQPRPAVSPVAAATKQQRRLSRISPSEFDSILDSGNTVKLASADTQLAADLEPSSSSSSDPSTDASSPPGLPVPPGLSPEPRDKKRTVRRAKSALESVAEGGSPSRTSGRSPGTQDALESWDAFTANRRPRAESLQRTGSPRSGAAPLPASTSSGRPTSSGRDSQRSNPSSTATRESATGASRTDALDDQSRALSSSTISTGSFVHVPFPPAPVENRLQPTPSRGDLSGSTASLGLGFDFSPMRKRTQSGETAEGKMSLAGTMRKTSRFFRKLGGSSSPASKATSTPSSPFVETFRAPLPPAVPTVPTTYSPPRSVTSASFTTSTSRQSPAPRSPRVNRRDLPRLPSPADIPSPEPGVSVPLARETSNQSVRSAASQTSTARGHRRRSVSLGSLRRDVHEVESAGSGTDAAAGTGARAGRSGTRTEDDQLRRELRRWRLGGDGVLGTAAGGGTLTPSSSLGASSTIASQSSPQLNRGASDESAPPPGAAGLETRRASVPSTTKELPPVIPSRAASLPVTTMPPIPSFSPVALRSPLSPSSPDTPEIRLTPSSRNGSVSSAVTIGPGGGASLARGSASRSSASSSTEDGHGTVGLGLSTISESAHSRESTLVAAGPAAVPVTAPARRDSLPDSTAPSGTGAKPLPGPPPTRPAMPLSEPSSASSTLSNRSKGPRGSIVGITPPLAPPAAARLNASLSSSTGSFTSLASRTTTTGRGGASKRAAEAAAEEALSEGEVRDKAGRLAERAWDEDEGFLERRKIAEWLGSAGRVNAAALRLYMNRFDFQALSLDAAFRRLCGKLYLKAETQQVDRILEQFSRRYFDDNPRTVYGSSDVVHAVSYSLLLLNTDLHVVDSTTRMTRAQFIRNTLDAIHAQTGAGESELLADASPPTDSSSSVFRLGDAAASRRSLDQSGARGAGNDERPSVVSLVEGAPDLPAASVAGSPVITRTGPDGAKDSPARALSVATVPKLDEASLQAALKDVYNAIKSQPIYQISSGSGSSSALHLPQDAPAASRSSFSLSPVNSPYATWGGGAGGGGVSRAASRRSATSIASGTPSASSSSVYHKRASIRGMGVFLGASSSLDLARSTSPTPSTATSLSDERWNTAYGPASQHHHVPTIGFANSLSHTIIREQHEGSGADDARSESSEVEVSDEELALLGAPWAKEGILSRKHYWESGGRRAKDKAWVQAFVVVSQGELQMFRFDGAGGGGTSRAMGGVGGGDWTANASAVGSIPLIHALCSAMPPPGYSRERPHCFVLTLPGGGSYFFQAGTPDLVAEWVSTCNYWAARLSKEPLSGGVSNMEYGWNRVAAPAAPDEDEREEIASIRSGHSRLSYASSAFHSSALGSGADRTHVNEWKPPQVPLAPSQLPEEAQLEALRKHAGIVERELAQHNALRAPMLRLYPSRSAAGTKALSNWERKAQHLVAEGTKYRTYVDALASAVRLRALRRGQKEVARMLERADAGADEDDEAEELVAGLTPYDEAPSRA